MGAERMMTIDCTVISEVATGEKDRSGDPITETVELETKCAFQQEERTEHEDGGEVSDTRWFLSLPWGTKIGSGATVVVKGRQYEVKGEVWEAEEGSRSLWHVEATVTRKAGTGES